MKAIYASKIYKGLSADSKQRVKSAVADPVNLELVTQLKSYLDEEYQAIAEPGTDAVVDDMGTTDTAEGGDTSAPGGSPAGGGGFGGGGGGSSFGDKVDDIEEDLGDMPMGDGSDSADTDTDTEDVAESVSVKKTAVTASSSLINAPTEIKGMLNLDADTQGVALVKYSESELWVYYQDDINLNNIMYNVIEKINSSGYSYLTFNRLARSDNAIVFDVGVTDTDNEVKPLEADEK